MKINLREVRRQLFHLFSGIILVSLLHYRIITLRIIAVILIVGIIFSYLAKIINFPIINFFLRQLDRQHDVKSIPGIGAITFLFGSIFALILFKRDIALAAILIMAIGDSIGPLIGLHFGKTPTPINKRKLLEGMLAGAVTAFLGALIFVAWYEALLASIIAMIVESLDLRAKNLFLNDNITMPIAAGLTIYLLRLL